MALALLLAVVRTETAALAPPVQPQAQPYNLGRVWLTQTGVPEPLQQMPVSLQGVLAVPTGPGPFPVVVILHGRHPGCHFQTPWSASTWPCSTGSENRYDQGFSYLAEALAQRGYLALAINLNGAYAYAYGASAANYTALAHQRSPQIVAAHLAQLAAAHRGEAEPFGQPLAGRVDLSQLVLIGHSLGGAAAVLSGHQRQGHTQPAQIQQGQGPLAGLLLLAPTPSQAIALHAEAYELPDVPTSVVLGGCDRDIYDFSSLYYFETAAGQNRQHLAASVLLPGANHNFFNRSLLEDDYAQQPDSDPLCGIHRPSRLTRAAQETFLINYAAAFLDHVLAARSRQSSPQPAAIALAPAQAVPAHLFQTPALTNLALPRDQYRRVPLLPAAGSDINTSADAPVVQPCPALQACGPYWRPQPLFPAVLRLSWQRRGTQLPLPLPADLADLRAFASLQLRLAVDVTDALNDGQAQALAVVLRDRAGRSARVDIPSTAPALRTYPPDRRWGYQGLPVYPNAVRIPLTQFEAVDLSEIEQMSLLFDRSDRGVFFLADISLLKEN